MGCCATLSVLDLDTVCETTMKILTAFCIFAVVCSALGAPDLEIHGLVEVSNHIDVMTDTRNLIEQLVENLHKSAQEALDSVNTFNAGILKEAKDIRDKIVSDVQVFRNRVTEAVESVMNRFSNTGVAVKECVNSHRYAAAAVFNETLSKTMSCVDERITEVSNEIKYLVSIANDAKAAGAQAIEDMRKCTGDSPSVWSAGTCLGAVMVKIELKSIGFLSHSTLTIGRINLGIASLPAALEVCAGTRLVQTGIQTGKILVEIGGCSASGIFNTILGRPTTTGA